MFLCRILVGDEFFFVEEIFGHLTESFTKKLIRVIAYFLSDKIMGGFMFDNFSIKTAAVNNIVDVQSPHLHSFRNP